MDKTHHPKAKDPVWLLIFLSESLNPPLTETASPLNVTSGLTQNHQLLFSNQ